MKLKIHILYPIEFKNRPGGDLVSVAKLKTQW